MAVKPEDLPAHVKSLYRLRPDRRFLYAVAELERLTRGGDRRGTLSIRFERDRWHLSLDGTPLGDLPEFPAFADAKSFLASRLGSPRAASRTEPPPMDLEAGSATLLPALASLNAPWAAAPGDPALAEAALGGYLWLGLQSFDELELGDPILGKSLALLVIAQGGAAGRLVREECLLADLLGYEDHAQLLARQLPADDPVRLFATWDLARLKALAHRRNATPRTQYLYLLRLAQNSTKEQVWFPELDATSWGRRTDGPSLRLVLTLDPWGTSPASLMELEILEGLTLRAREPRRAVAEQRDTGWQASATQRLDSLRRNQASPEGRLAAFEAGVRSEAARLGGPILDRSVVQAFYLAGFYSSVYLTARFDFDRYGSTDEGERFANSLEKPPPGTAAELKDWMLHRVHLRRSAEGLRAVEGDLSRLRHIGTAPLSRISYSIAISVSSSTDTTVRAPLPGYFSRLDSRPSNLHAAFRTASELLNDPAIIEQCMRLAAARAPRAVGGDLPWTFTFLGDPKGLRALASDGTWPPSIRSAAIQELASSKDADVRPLMDQLRELVREDPEGSTPIRTAVVILENRGEIESALQLIDSWLKVHSDHDLEWAGVSSVKARLLRKQGKAGEAWKIAKEAAAESGKAECLEEGVLALLDLGRVDDALEMARDALARYGSDDQVVLVARILWMKGKDEEAARLVTSAEKRLTAGAWAAAVPAAFLSAFRKDDDARAEAAFQKLFVPSIPQMSYVWFLEFLTHNGRPTLTTRLCAGLRGRGPAGWTTVAEYHAIGKSQSAAAAREWLRANSRPADLDVLSKQALQDGDYELIWDLPDHPDATKNEILYMIRAACLLYPNQASDERRARLVTFFEGRSKKDFVVYGLFLLGKLDRQTLFAQIKDLTYVASVGWIVGLTAQHENRYEEANAWLQVCLEAGQNIPPRYWATATLNRWRAANCTLAELARRGIY